MSVVKRSRPAGAVALHHLVETRFVNGDLAALQHFDLARVHIHA
jgi:uncharacterized protein with von Willebrand factor type A (vWA) domain